MRSRRPSPSRIEPRCWTSADEVEAEVDVADEGPGEETGEDAFSALVESRYKEYRADFIATLMGWFRDLMALVAYPPSHSAYDDGERGAPLVNEARRGVLETRAANLSLAFALRNVEAVEDLARSLDRNMNEAAVLSFFMDRIRLGGSR